ncbi:hypothetical protein [Pleurocapsa sp. PCC 7319]|uniref:hypothetical protein n=1 Tax=Pleurocapsa sp. PCC 7319 TaxID=118161 RepID=UPI00178C7B56|nr:hypothetical protein [Pleurocapsa sp. PCC 7319]
MINAKFFDLFSGNAMAKLVKSSVSFTRADVEDQNTLLCLIYVQRPDNVIASDREISDRLTSEIQNHLIQKNFKATPLVNVNVLEPPNN